MPLELLVLTTNPPHQSRFEAIKDSEQCRSVEVSIVVYPSSQYRVVTGRQLTDAGRGLFRQLPTLDRAQHLLGRIQAHRGQETVKQLPVAILRSARPERVTQEGKLLIRMRLAALTVLTIHNGRLLQIQTQPA